MQNHIQWLGIFFKKTVPVWIFFKKKEKKKCVFLTPLGKGMHISNNKLYFNNKYNKA